MSEGPRCGRNKRARPWREREPSNRPFHGVDSVPHLAMFFAEANVQVTIDIPDLVAASRTSEEWSNELSRISVFEAFRRGDISSGRGAQILGIGLLDFLEEAGTHGVPTINYDMADFEQELQEIAKQGG